MSKPIFDLQAILEQLIGEHRRLLALADQHQKAMKTFDLNAMGDLAHLQESSRLRLATLEHKRKAHVQQIGKAMRLTGEPKITQLAEMFPQFKPALLKQRDELRGLMDEIARKNFIAGKVAGTVLGHLNTVVRLLAGAVEKAGLYTRQGVPKVSARIGMMEAIG